MVLFIIEAAVWFGSCYYWSKYLGYRSILMLITALYPVVIVVDPILYQWGMIWSPSTLVLSFILATISYVASLGGIVLQKLAHRIRTQKHTIRTQDISFFKCHSDDIYNERT